MKQATAAQDQVTTAIIIRSLDKLYNALSAPGMVPRFSPEEATQARALLEDLRAGQGATLFNALSQGKPVADSVALQREVDEIRRDNFDLARMSGGAVLT